MLSYLDQQEISRQECGIWAQWTYNEHSSKEGNGTQIGRIVEKRDKKNFVTTRVDGTWKVPLARSVSKRGGCSQDTKWRNYAQRSMMKAPYRTCESLAAV
jgi:hypothetical protein